MTDVPNEVERLREQLREAADALVAVGKAAIVVKPRLEEPYSDAPSTSPWTKFMEAPARRAYNLGSQLRAQSRGKPSDPSKIVMNIQQEPDPLRVIVVSDPRMRA